MFYSARFIHFFSNEKKGKEHKSYFTHTVVIICLTTVLVLFGTTSAAMAARFNVNSTGDEVDHDPGDGVCETGFNNGICTLRAALDEAKALLGSHTINFNIDVVICKPDQLQQKQQDDTLLHHSQHFQSAGSHL